MTDIESDSDWPHAREELKYKTALEDSYFVVAPLSNPPEDIHSSKAA